MLPAVTICAWILMAGQDVEGCYQTFEQCKQQEEKCDEKYLFSPCLCTLDIREKKEEPSDGQPE